MRWQLMFQPTGVSLGWVEFELTEVSQTMITPQKLFCSPIVQDCHHTQSTRSNCTTSIKHEFKQINYKNLF